MGASFSITRTTPPKARAHGALLQERQPGASSVNGNHGRFLAIQYPGKSTSQNFGSPNIRITGCSHRGCQPLDHAINNAITGNDTTSKGFMVIAPGTSKCASACSARVVPQPGQYNPVSALNMQGGNGLSAALGSNLRST